MQSTLDFRTNRDLFSNHYLTEHLPETEQWQEVPDEDVESVYENVRELWESEQDLVSGYNEASLQNNFIDPVLEELGITFEIEETVERNARRPDYAFFADADARTAAFEHRDEGGDFYEEAIAVADAKRWGRKLDTRGEGERDFENPSYQIHVYLQETPAQWAVLTNGRKWRLYYGPTSHRLDSYYEIDLPTLLEQGGVVEFRYFYLFFRRDAFVEDSGGDCFLDDVYDESNTFAEALGEDLQDNIYDAIGVLAEGFLEYNDDLGEDDLELIHDSSLTYLYRLIFVLYAESEGRELLPTDNDIYRESYSLNELKQTVVENLDDSQEHYYSFQTDLSVNLDELFDLIDKGSESRDIDPELLYIPAYNGGLFRTDPDADDSAEANFLASYDVDDEHLAEVIDLLTRRDAENGTGKVFTDYSSLDIRHLGSIYEGLLEYELNIAEDALTLEDGEYAIAEEGEEIIVEPGEVYMTTDSGERKATGSYYTPEYVVEYIVENTLGPLVDDVREGLMARSAHGDRGFAEEFAQEVFDLDILDPAMGSGHFLTSAVDYLAREIINAQERQAEQQGVETIDQSHDINWARRQVAQKCIYGVDLNPMAVELAKVSLWLRTLAAEQPLAFLDHHLKTGNTLIGSDIEQIENLESGMEADSGKNRSLTEFGVTRRGTIEQLMGVYQDFIAIENRDRADVKEMEQKYREIEKDALRNRLIAIANVRTAEDFDSSYSAPGGAYQRMAAGIDDEDEWADIATKNWFKEAQKLAAEENFLHWKLEFPEVFYDTHGEPVDNPGLDAVIGNPPYVGVSGQLEEYLRKMYSSPEYFVDTFHVFIEKGIDLSKDGGRFGYIVPEPWLTMENTEQLRNYVLSNTAIREIVRFDNKVFDDATVDTLILNLQKSNDWGEIQVKEAVNEDGAIVELNGVNEINQDRLLDTSLKRIEVRQSATEADILDKIRDHGVELNEITEVSIGIQAYNRTKHTEEQIENRVFHADHKKSEDYLPEISGQDVSRYHVTHDGETWVKYGDHLHDYRPMRYFSDPRILVREITDAGKHKIHAAYTEETYCNYKTILNILPGDNYDPLYLLAVLNSAPMSWIFLRASNKVVSDTFPRISVADLENLLIPAIDFNEKASEVPELEGLMAMYRDYLEAGDPEPMRASVRELSRNSGGYPDVIHDFLAIMAENLIDWTEKRETVNLDLLDYLGNYEDGDALPELTGYQPAPGVHETILAESEEEKEGLKIGTLTAEEKDGKLIVSASVRFKPEDENEFASNRWDGPDHHGFIESREFIPAMEFRGLRKVVRVFIREFINTVDEEGNGFAGYYDNATKTNSLIDRIEAITIPDIDQVEDQMNRYVDQRERFEQLTRDIELTSELVDDMVYRLYGLDDEEIETIEAGLAES